MKSARTLSVLVPVYDEEHTIYELLTRVADVELPVAKEVVVVDDGSSDRTTAEVERFVADRPDLRLTFERHAQNRGKGAAVRTALGLATGDIVLIQDGDLEYHPKDIPALLEPLLDGRADAVFGSRFLGGPHRVLFFWHAVANKSLTLLSNLFTNFNLTDMEVCYKVFRREILEQITVEENRFGFEPEITAKVAKLGCRIYEVGISYAGRTYAEGKKIGWRDGVAALRCILKYNLLR